MIAFANALKYVRRKFHKEAMPKLTKLTVGSNNISPTLAWYLFRMLSPMSRSRI